MTRTDLPTARDIRIALLRVRLRARQVEAARARLADAVDEFNAADHVTPVERLHAIHQLNRLRLALAIAEGRPPPYSLRGYKCR